MVVNRTVSDGPTVQGSFVGFAFVLAAPRLKRVFEFCNCVGQHPLVIHRMAEVKTGFDPGQLAMRARWIVSKSRPAWNDAAAATCSGRTAAARIAIAPLQQNPTTAVGPGATASEEARKFTYAMLSRFMASGVSGAPSSRTRCMVRSSRKSGWKLKTGSSLVR